MSSNSVQWKVLKTPRWWPKDVEFKNPSGKDPFNKDSSDSVISSYIENGNVCFELVGDEVSFDSEDNQEVPCDEAITRLNESVFFYTCI